MSVANHVQMPAYDTADKRNHIVQIKHMSALLHVHMHHVLNRRCSSKQLTQGFAQLKLQFLKPLSLITKTARPA